MKKIRNEKNKYALYKKENNKIKWFSILLEKKDNNNQKYLYAPRGPILDYANLENLRQYLMDIKGFLKSKNLNKLVINPKVKKIDIDELTDNNYFINKRDKIEFEKLQESPKEALLELYEDEEKFLMKLDSKTRYNIRRTQRKNLKVEVTSEINIKEFMILYKQTAERHKFKMHDEKYFQSLLEVFKNKIICCVVKYNNIPLAMSINIGYKETLEYVYGASSNNYRDLMPCYLLHWTMIKYAKRNKFKYYNFGGVYCEDNDKENKDYGLMIFKSKFCINGFIEYESDLQIFFNSKEIK